MNAKELKRFEILSRVQRGEMTLQAAATVLGIEYRQSPTHLQAFSLGRGSRVDTQNKGKTLWQSIFSCPQRPDYCSLQRTLQ